MGKTRYTRFLKLPLLVIAIVVVVCIVKRQQDIPYQKNSGFVFGTVYNFTYQAEEDLDPLIKTVLADIDHSMSPFNKQSVITAINNNVSMKTDPTFEEIFAKAMRISEETDGCFDITVAPLVNAWGFGFRHDTKPDRHTIDSLRQIIGYKKVYIENHRVVKADPRVMLDCSAIAKGYACDRVADFLRGRGVENFIVDIGGEVVTSGLNPQRLPWKIGVVKPTEDSLNTSQELQTVLNLTDKAMATSGNYRNFYYKDGKKYAHTIDPKTGNPVQHQLLSATVIGDNCATCDAFATSFMVMGLDRAKALLARHPELQAYFIYADEDGEYQVWKSEGLGE